MASVIIDTYPLRTQVAIRSLTTEIVVPSNVVLLNYDYMFKQLVQHDAI